MDKYESTLNSMINKCGDIVREINNNVKIDDDEEEEQNKFGQKKTHKPIVKQKEEIREKKLRTQRATEDKTLLG